MNVRVKWSWIAALIAGAVTSPARADWPDFLGPDHDNVCREKDVNAGSATKLWTANVGTGFSAVAIADQRAFTMGNDGGQDAVVCLDANSGKPLWKYGYPAAIGANSYEGGPNATPAVYQGKVYTLGKQGKMLCLDAASGAVVWDRNAGGLAVEPPTWGYAGGPVIAGDAVVYNVGARGVALDRTTGATLWGAGGGGAGYATPVPFDGGGGKDTAVALFNSAGLFGLDAKTGTPLWKFDWNTSFEVNAASPTPIGSAWFVSTGYDTGCARVDVAGGQTTQAWRNRSMCSHFNTSAVHEGFIYGVDGNSGRRCALVCLNAADGSVAWRHACAFGTMRLVDGKVFFLDENGMLFVVKAASRAYQEIARHRVLGGKCWTVPTITGKRLWARNAAGELVCMQLEGGALTAEPLPANLDVNLDY